MCFEESKDNFSYWEKETYLEHVKGLFPSMSSLYIYVIFHLCRSRYQASTQMDMREICGFYSLFFSRVWIYFYLFLFVCRLLIHSNSIQLSLFLLCSLSTGALQHLRGLVVLLFWATEDSSVQQVTGNNDVLVCGSQRVASCFAGEERPKLQHLLNLHFQFPHLQV